MLNSICDLHMKRHLIDLIEYLGQVPTTICLLSHLNFEQQG